jgi:hypothetical protein
MSFHLVVESENRETLTNIFGALLDEKIPEDSILMLTCSKSSGKYRAVADIGGPEATA